MGVNVQIGGSHQGSPSASSSSKDGLVYGGISGGQAFMRTLSPEGEKEWHGLFGLCSRSAWSCQDEGAMMVGPAVVYIHFGPNQALSALNIKFKDFVCHWGFIRDDKLFWSLWGGTKLTSVCCRHNSGHLHRRASMASERSLLQFTGWCESLSTNCRELCKCWSLANAAKA